MLKSQHDCLNTLLVLCLEYLDFCCDEKELLFTLKLVRQVKYNLLSVALQGKAISPKR